MTTAQSGGVGATGAGNTLRPSTATPGNGNGLRPQTRELGSPGASNSHPVVRGVTGRPIPQGSRAQVLRSGSAIQRRPDGRISDVHDVNRGMDIHHDLNGGQRISVVRSDHSVIVAERGRPGFIQRPYAFFGRNFAQRTYFDHGRDYQHFYRESYYHGIAIHVYAPVRYYSVGFYGWAYHPWARRGQQNGQSLGQLAKLHRVSRVPLG